MTSLTICAGLAALLYLAAGIGIVASMKGEGAKASSLLRWPVLLGLLLHGYSIEGELFQTGSVHFGFGFCVSAMMLFAVLVLFIESWVHRIHGQFGIILIAAAFGAVCPILFPAEPLIDAAEWTTLFRWHLLFAVAAYSFMTIAVVHAVLMALQNRYLKTTIEQPKFLDTMPGLVVMERIFFRIVAVGFACMTMVLLLGALATHEAYGVYFHFDHKTILTWIAWVLFGILLCGRRFAGWRAKTALRWFWAGIAVFAVAYLGYSFILSLK